MGCFEGVPRQPHEPRVGPRRIEPAEVQPGAGAQLLTDLRDLLEALRAAPGLVAQLSETDLTDLAQSGIELTRAGEALAVAATAEAIDRGVVAGSMAAGTTGWVRGLCPGTEPSQAHRVAVVAEELASRSGLARIHPADLAPDDPASAGEGDGEDDLVQVDPTGRTLLAEAVCSGAVNVRTAASVVREAPRVQQLIPEAPRAEVFSWFLALGDDATDRDRRNLTRQLIARFDPDQLSRDEAAAQRRESVHFSTLPCGLVRLVAELSPANAALVKQAIARLSAPDPQRCDEAASNAPQSGSRGTGEAASNPSQSDSRGTGEAASNPLQSDSRGTGGAASNAPQSDSRGVGEEATNPRPGTTAEAGAVAPRDERSPGKRRADALVELIEKAAGLVPGAASGSITGHAKAVVLVDLETLTGQRPSDAAHQRPARPQPAAGRPPDGPSARGAPAQERTRDREAECVDPDPRQPVAGPDSSEGTPGDLGDAVRLEPRGRASRSAGRWLPGTGRTPYGDLLDPSMLRRFACDAGIIPAVLGADGSPIDVGREERLFTGRLRTAVVLRDRQCSFPGCDRPPDWCEVHHLIPWWAGGPTTLDNGALLCGRHHTIVHRDGFAGEVQGGRVFWDHMPGRLDQLRRAG